MIRAEYSFTLPVTPEVTFAYLSNPANDKEWQGACVESHLLDSKLEVGCRYQIKFNFIGRKMQFNGEVILMQEPHAYGFRVLTGPFHYEGRYTFSADPLGTRVHWQFDIEPGKFFGIIPSSLLRKLLVAQVEKDSHTLARVLANLQGNAAT